MELHLFHATLDTFLDGVSQLCLLLTAWLDFGSDACEAVIRLLRDQTRLVIIHPLQILFVDLLQTLVKDLGEFAAHVALQVLRDASDRILQLRLLILVDALDVVRGLFKVGAQKWQMCKIHFVQIQ